MGNKPQPQQQTQQATTNQQATTSGLAQGQQSGQTFQQGLQGQFGQTIQELSPEQRALIEPIIPLAQSYLQNPPKLMEGSQVAGFDPWQLLSQEMLVGSAGQLSEGLKRALGQANFFTSGDVLDPSRNPGLQGTIDAAGREINRNLFESILPGLRDEEILSGQYGGSRGRIAEGMAASEAGNQFADASSRLLSQNYLTGLGEMNKALALTPQFLSMLGDPARMVGEAGAQRQDLQQRLLDEQAFRHMFEQLSPWLAAQEVGGFAMGLPGGTTTTMGGGFNQGLTESFMKSLMETQAEQQGTGSSSGTTTGTAPRQDPMSTALGIGALLLSLMPGGQVPAMGMSAAATPGLF